MVISCKKCICLRIYRPLCDVERANITSLTSRALLWTKEIRHMGISIVQPVVF